MAWGPLAQGSDRLFTDETLKAIGTKYGKTNAQVALKFLTSEGIVAIPKSIHKDRMAISMIQIWQGIYWNMTKSLIRTADRRCCGMGI